MWILAVLALVLLVWSLTGRTRERFDIPPVCPAGFNMVDQENTMCLRETQSVCPPNAQFPIGDFGPDGQCATNEDRDGEAFPMVCPEGSGKYGEDGRTCYEKRSPTCPAGYTQYDPNQNGIQMCKKIPPPPTTSTTTTTTTSSPPVSPPVTTPETVEPSASPASATAETVDTSRTSGTTTGGTSGTTQGANSGGGGARRKQVFGPIFTGLGDGGVVPSDSSKTNQYPELLGGDGGRASTRIDGAGIVNPSGGGITLPPSSSLGSDENSKYFPFSRQPGDMELIPDPYRVSQQFSASNYSFKTEPVPFLTDFSAFQR